MSELKSTAKLGILLRELRIQKGLGVNQLAGYVGISGAEISRIERGERKRIPPDLLKQLAPRLGVTYEFLMKEAGYLPGRTADKDESYVTSFDLLDGLDRADRKLVLDLIKRLKKD